MNEQDILCHLHAARSDSPGTSSTQLPIIVLQCVVLRRLDYTNFLHLDETYFIRPENTHDY